jgi:flagellar assembly factor FliW
VIVKTGRFEQLTIDDRDVITIPTGVLGFPEYTRFCLVDPGDETLILWLQSLDNPEIAFPLLEPKVFKSDYSVRLSAAELRELKLENVNQSAVFSILTIPADVTQMTANLKAPIVINLRENIAKQVVLQENEYSIKNLMFKELRAHLITIQSQAKGPAQEHRVSSVSIKDIPPSLTVRSLQA